MSVVWQPSEDAAFAAFGPCDRPSPGPAVMGLTAIYKHPRTIDPHPEHRIYPYLVAIMDWTSRKVQAWRAAPRSLNVAKPARNYPVFPGSPA